MSRAELVQKYCEGWCDDGGCGKFDDCTGCEIEAAFAALEGDAQPVAQCDRCQGNGEIVTNWNEYLKPPADAPADHATETCPDCDGTGRATPPTPKLGVAVEALTAVMTWADQRCPCHNDEPNPCPLCGASIENLEACKSAENTFPPRLLKTIREALSQLEKPGE